MDITDKLYFLHFSLCDWAFIGLTDEHQESDFRWLNNAPLYYDKWGNSEPNGNRQQNCVRINGNSLEDGPCSDEAVHLCSDIGEFSLQSQNSHRFLSI